MSLTWHANANTTEQHTHHTRENDTEWLPVTVKQDVFIGLQGMGGEPQYPQAISDELSRKVY